MNSRRKFIRESVNLITGWLGVAFIATGCNDQSAAVKEAKTTSAADPCEDFSGVSEKDLDARKKLGYVKDSPIADSTCNKCNLFLPPQDSKPCGACMLFKGPVYATGYCTYWAAKQG